MATASNSSTNINTNNNNNINEETHKFLRVDLFWIQVMFFIFSIFLFAVCMYACLFVRWVYKRRLNQKIEDMINRYYRDDENRKRAQIDMKKEEIGAGDFRQECICRKNQHICQIARVITDGNENNNDNVKPKNSKEIVKVVKIDENKGNDSKQGSMKLPKYQSKHTISFHDVVKSMQSDPDVVKTMPVLKQAVQDVACQTIDDSLYPPPPVIPQLAPIIAPPPSSAPKKQRSNSDLFEDYGSMNYYENNGKVSGIMNASQMSQPTVPLTSTSGDTTAPTTNPSTSVMTTPSTTTATSTPTKRAGTPKPMKKRRSMAKIPKSPRDAPSIVEKKVSDPIVSMREPNEKDLGGKSSSVGPAFFPINTTSSPFAENSTRLFPFFNKATTKPPTTSSKKSETTESTSSKQF